MKSFFILLLIAVLVALLTVPGQGKFDKYLAKKGKNAAVCIGGKRHYAYKLFSIDYVDYCEAGVAANQQGSSLPGFNKTRTDKYLGLFGTFWKL
jgi:competence protein ComGC